MRFFDRFLRLSIVVGVILTMVVAFAFAMASALLIPDDPALPQIAAEVATPQDTAATVVPAAPSVEAPPTSNAVASTGMASVSCERPAGQPAGGVPYSIRVSRTGPGPEPIAVAIDLVTLDGQHLRRTIEAAVVLSTDGSLEIPVPDSTGTDYQHCLVVAIQRGDRVVFTGS